MLIERDLQLGDLGQLALIDRKELIEQFYRVQAGRLELYDEYCAMSGWPEGEAEQDAVILRRCFEQGAWFHGVFAGPTLVAAAVLGCEPIHNDGRRLLQLKFLHVSHDYRGLGWRADCLPRPPTRPAARASMPCMSRPPRRAIPWSSTSGAAAGCWSGPILACTRWNRTISTCIASCIEAAMQAMDPVIADFSAANSEKILAGC